MAWYNKGKNQNKHGACRFFNTTEMSYMPQNSLFIWKPCSENQTCGEAKNRCRGYWSRQNLTLMTYQLGPIHSFKRDNLQDSLTECIKNDYCGSVTVNSSNYVTFNPVWPRSRTNLVENSSSTTYEWTCCEHYPPDSPCTPNVTQIWKRDTVIFQENKYFIHRFYTFDRTICFRECRQHDICQYAWFSQETFLCLLQVDDSQPHYGTCASRLQIDRSEIIELLPWKLHKCPNTAKNDKSVDVFNDITIIDDRQESSNSCVCIQDVTKVTVREDECDKPDYETNARPIVNGMAFFANKEKVHESGQYWQRVFNGVRYGWLNDKEGGTKICEIQNCHLYSGEKISHVNCPNIIPRSAWDAINATGIAHRNSRPNKVVISSTVDPKCPCYTEGCATEYMRAIQRHDMYTNKYHDIAANFLVSMNGRIYNGRGVDVIGQMLDDPKLDEESITILFLGEFDHEAPSLTALNNIKVLIDCLQSEQNYRYPLNNNYILYGARDFNETISGELPGQILYGVLHNWLHYKGIYKNPNPLCNYKTPAWIIVVPSVLGSVILVSILIGVALYYIKKQKQQELNRRYELCCRPIGPDSGDSEAFL